MNHAPRTDWAANLISHLQKQTATPKLKNLAYIWQDRGSMPIMFLPGFASNMQGSKASALDIYCAQEGLSFLRFDYSGHGLSDGHFCDGTINEWLDDAIAIFDRVIKRSAILVGSSMGGWLMIHLALKRPQLVTGLIGIASAPDFTTGLANKLSDDQAHQLRRKGQIALPSAYGDPLIVTKKLIEQASSLNLLHQSWPLACPCHLIHGQLDEDVPWTVSIELASRLETPHITIELIKDGDHRLSRESDLRRITNAIERIANYPNA